MRCKLFNAYLAVMEETPDQVAVHDFEGMLKTLLPIQMMINGLVDLKSFEKRDLGLTKKAKLIGVEMRVMKKGFAKGL